MPPLLLLLSLPMAQSAPQADWMAEIVRASGVDGHRAPSAERVRRLEAYCPKEPLACAWADVADDGANPLRAVADAAANLCSEEAPAACLVHAWALGMDPDTGPWRSAAEVDGVELRRALGLACGAGLRRACVEVGWTEHLALGTYAKPEEATKRWRSLCDAGEGAACRALAITAAPDEAIAFHAKALTLADPQAPLLAVGDAAGRGGLLEQACEAGVAEACVAAARGASATGRIAWLEKGCATTAPEACARLALAQSASSLTTVEALRALAPRWSRAGTWAGLVEQGVPLDPFTEPAQLLAVHQSSLDYDVRTALRGCYLRLLARKDVEGWVDVDLLTDAAGHVVGAGVQGIGFDDDGFRSCAAGELTGVRPLQTDGVPRLAHAQVSLAHTVAIKALPVADDVKGLTRVAESADDWRASLSACAVGRGAMYADSIGMYRIKVKRTGEVLDATTRHSSELPEVDVCVTERLLGFTSTPLITGLKVDLKVTFLQPRELPPPEPVFRTEPFAFEGTPTPFKVLLWFVDDLQVAGERARFTDPSQASVIAAFEAAAAQVSEHSGGAIDVQVEARRVGSIGGSHMGDGRRGILTWNVAPGELPFDALRTLERDTWDAVMLWAPIPRGLPRPYGSVSWTQAQLHGAAIATSTLEEGRELLMLDGTDPSVFALQMLYTAWSSRAERLLHTALPPNDRPLRLGPGRKLEPRIGLTDDPMDFYRHVFYNHLSPDLWRDLRGAMHDAHALQEGNLAYSAHAVGHDRLRNAHLLVDGLWEAGDYEVAAIDPADPEDDDPRWTWMGLRWEEAQQVGRVRGRLHTEAAPELEVQTHISGRWKKVGSVTPDGEGVFDFSWPGTDTDGVRVQLTAKGDVRVDELEAYAPAK